jgi:tellurite resistance protein TerC
MDGIGSPALWAGFLGFVVVMLALDLGVFHRKAHEVRVKEALGWSLVWISLALAFNGLVWWRFGSQAGIEFLTGYLIEKSLSVDNIFVFVVIFGGLSIPAAYQHRVLFWGILSALVLRAGMIFAGTALLARFHWLIYVFGGFLVLTAVKLVLAWRAGDEGTSTENRLLALARRVLPATDRLDGQRFFTRENGRRLATPLLLALVLVEVTDVIFAVDSIPAVLAITEDPFIVFTSNVFAILGLRSLYFLLAGVVDRFRYLKLGLAGVLAFVGAKMVATEVYEIPAAWSLAVVAVILAASIIASWRANVREAGRAGGEPGRAERDAPRDVA